MAFFVCLETKANLATTAKEEMVVVKPKEKYVHVRDLAVVVQNKRNLERMLVFFNLL